MTGEVHTATRLCPIAGPYGWHSFLLSKTFSQVGSAVL